MSDLSGKVEHAERKRKCMFHNTVDAHDIKPKQVCFTIRSEVSNNTYNICEKGIEEILNELEDERTMNGEGLIT